MKGLIRRLPAFTVLAVSVAAPVAAADDPAITFNEHIAPIIFQHCTPCHRPGEVAPFSLLTYDDARGRARLIADATEQRFMPPWMPEADEGEFDGDRSLSEADIKAIRQWVDGGAVEGESGVRPATPTFAAGWQFGRPDLVLTMADAFVMPSSGPDVFRNFVLSVPIKSRRYVRAVEFRPGGTRAIHHARMLVDETRESRWRDARDEAVGFGGMDAPGAHFPDGHFLGWAAGKSPSATSLPWAIEAGSDLVVQVHLKPTGRPESVQISIGLYFSNKPPDASPIVVRLGTRTFDIPAGAENHVVSDSYVLPVDVDVLRIYPHAHYLGKRMMVTARTRGGRVERLLSIPRWDFNWQDDYEYARPVSLARGTTISMYYVYDNSPANPHNPHVPPAPVHFGPEATDEMAELLLQVVPKKAADAGTLRADTTRKNLLTDIAGEEKRVAERPDDVDGRNALGVHYIQMGRVDDAVEQFTAALRIAPSLAVANYNLGVVAMGRGLVGEAADRLQRALTARPDYPEAHVNFGVLLLRAGRLNEAVGHFRSALALKPDNGPAHNNLGRALLQMDRPDEALAEFRELVRLQPNNPTALDSLAQAHAATGNPAQALRVAQQALDLAIASKNDALAREIRLSLEGYMFQISSNDVLR
jgi:tetratricopeptide (TPR) repeat protein